MIEPASWISVNTGSIADRLVLLSTGCPNLKATVKIYMVISSIDLAMVVKIVSRHNIDFVNVCMLVVYKYVTFNQFYYMLSYLV